MEPLSKPNDSLLLSYLELRTSIGVIGILLPFVVAIGKILLESPGILSSISTYYYTIMGDVFVGSLCATGVFLWSYRGYARIDSVAGNLAALSAIGLAFFPTAPMSPTPTQALISHIHLVFAAGFFLTLAFFALFLFRKTKPGVSPTRMKKVRNFVYAVCGTVILASIFLIALISIVTQDGEEFLNYAPVFWLESLATVAFGISWFVKGEAILKDD